MHGNMWLFLPVGSGDSLDAGVDPGAAEEPNWKEEI